MDCPGCQLEMTTGALGRARVDTCPACRGIWFDRGELETVRKNKSGARRETRTILIPMGEVADVACPRCEGGEMGLFKAHGFQVERCSGCGGIFFDGDEIEHLLEGWRSKRRLNRHRKKADEEAERRRAVIALIAGIVAGGGV